LAVLAAETAAMNLVSVEDGATVAGELALEGSERSTNSWAVDLRGVDAHHTFTSQQFDAKRMWRRGLEGDRDGMKGGERREDAVKIREIKVDIEEVGAGGILQRAKETGVRGLVKPRKIPVRALIRGSSGRTFDVGRA
jgi:hypothetical protein